MKIDPPKNLNYAAQVVRIPALVDLPGLDFLVGVPVLGHQALTTKEGATAGELRIAFTAETQLSDEYAKFNNLYREPELNSDPNETGYLEKNRRIRALKLKGHRSDALLMPLDSLRYAVSPDDLQEGDTFDILNGCEICNKYEIPVKANPRGATAKVDKAFKRVDKKLFPEHLETDQYGRSKHLLKPGQEVVVTQKLHGTSLRVGHVPCLRQKGWFERQLNRWFPTADYTYDVVFGSRKVIKDPNNPNQNHYYESDIWTEYGKTIADLIPEGYLVYGELIGWTPDGAAIQKGYTYDLSQNAAELYVYRVAVINGQGTLSDLSWDGVKEFCTARGLKWTPELIRLSILEQSSDDVDWDNESPYEDIDDLIERITDSRLADGMANAWDDFPGWTDPPVIVSSHKTVDEGVCLRQEGIVPTILKSKFAQFLAHETKLLDKGESDLESVA